MLVDPVRSFLKIMHDLQTLKDINEQEAATRALNAIRKNAELGKANRSKKRDAKLWKKFYAADSE